MGNAFSSVLITDVQPTRVAKEFMANFTFYRRVFCLLLCFFVVF